MKKVISLVLAMLIIVSLFTVNMSAFANDEIKILINGNAQTYDVMPCIINGRTLVPLRGIFEALGAEILWDDATKTVTGTKGNTKVVLTIGDTKAYVNGGEVTLDVPASIVSSRTMVPARFVAESLGCKVDWDGNTKTVIINSDNGLAPLKSTYHRPVPTEFELSSDLNDYYHFEGETIEQQEAKYAEVKKDAVVVCDDEEYLSQARLQGASQYGEYEVIDVENMPFKKIVRLKCTTVPEKDSLLILKTAATTEKVPGEGLSKDDQMLFAFRFRLAEGGENGIGKVKIQVEHPTTFVKAIFTEVTADKNWRIVYLPFKGKQDATSMGIRFGYSHQTIELGGIEVLNFGPNYDADKLPYTPDPCAGLEKDEQWRKDAIERIEKVRKGDFSVIVKDKDGNVIPDADVNFNMFEHEFQFGNVIRGTIRTDETFKNKFAELFNTGVLETSMKWAPYESNRSNSRTLVDLAKSIGVKNIRGHVLFWERRYGSDKKTNMTPDYMYADDIKGDKQKIEELSKAHVDDICNEFLGEVSDWDVINEIIDNHDQIEAYGSEELYKIWFDMARNAVGKDCDLYYNEAHILDGRLQEKVKMLCDMGTDFDGIGLQSHLDGLKYTPFDILNLYDDLRQFGKRIKVTEYSNSVPDPKIQGNYLRDMMIIAFAEEMIDGFVMWGFKDGAAFAAYTPIFDKEWNYKPGGLVYKDLVYNKWWTKDAKAKTDAQGKATVRGFYGDYDVTVSYNGITETNSVAFHKGYNNVFEITLDGNPAETVVAPLPEKKPSVNVTPVPEEKPTEEVKTEPIDDDNYDASLPQGGKVIIGMKDAPAGGEKSQNKVVTVSGNLITVDALKVPDNKAMGMWNMNKLLTSDDYAKGDTMLVTFKARLLSGGQDGKGFVKLQLQEGDSSKKSLFAGTSFTSDWTTCYLPFKQSADGVSLGLRPCYLVQKFEIKDFKLINFGTSVKVEDLPSTACEDPAQ